jgi:hypothetical protein
MPSEATGFNSLVSQQHREETRGTTICNAIQSLDPKSLNIIGMQGRRINRNKELTNGDLGNGITSRKQTKLNKGIWILQRIQRALLLGTKTRSTLSQSKRTRTSRTRQISHQLRKQSIKLMLLEKTLQTNNKVMVHTSVDYINQVTL